MSMMLSSSNAVHFGTTSFGLRNSRKPMNQELQHAQWTYFLKPSIKQFQTKSQCYEIQGYKNNFKAN